MEISSHLSPSAVVTGTKNLKQCLTAVGCISIDQYLEDLPGLLKGPDERLDGDHVDEQANAYSSSAGMDASATNAPSQSSSTSLPMPNASGRVGRPIVHSNARVNALGDMHSKISTNEVAVVSLRERQRNLTATRPDGSTMTHKSEITKETEAKAAIASSAIEMCAVAFGPNRNINNQSSQNFQPRLEAVVQQVSLIQAIEDCCIEWRPAHIRPCWTIYTDIQGGVATYGCALTLRLSQRCSQVYASNCVYHDELEAKMACALDAEEAGVFDFIKFGNGQTEPSPRDIADPAFKSMDTGSLMPLQTFYESLPRPFPEPFDNKNAAQINASSWMNTAIQMTKGAKLVVKYFYTSHTTLGSIGCVMRLERPGEVRSYIVDPVFCKRGDAKAAVCFEAMSQNVGPWLRSISAEVEQKLSPSMRHFAADSVYPILLSEASKIKHGGRIIYDFMQDADASGCILKAHISTHQFKEYSVPAEYQSRAHSKVAVALKAVAEGLVEYLRFGCESPPLGYVPSLANECKEIIAGKPYISKRKEAHLDGDSSSERQGMRPKKKRKLDAPANSAPVADAGSNMPVSGFGCSALPSVPAPPAVPVTGGGRPSWSSGVSGGVIVSLPGPPKQQRPRRDKRNKISSFPPPLLPRSANPLALPDMAHAYDARAGASQQPVYREVNASALHSQADPSAQASAQRQIIPGQVPQIAQSLNTAGDALLPGFPFLQPTTPPMMYPYGIVPRSQHFFVSTPTQESSSSSPLTPMVYEQPLSRPYPAPLKGTPPSIPASRIKSESRSPSVSVGSVTSPSTSNVSALLEFCTRTKQPPPRFQTEVICDKVLKTTRYKVWAILGKERLELLNKTYNSVKEGKERVAKQVLNRLKSQHASKETT